MMTIFIKKLLIFLSPILILAYPLDLFLSSQFKKAFVAEGEIGVWDDIYSGNILDSCFILGSSRAWVQFNPEAFLSNAHIGTYNFGIDGHNFFLQKARYDETVKYNHPPKYIILSVESTSLQKRSDLYNKEQFLPFMLWNKDIERMVDSYIGFSTVDFYIPLIRYTGCSIDMIKVFLNIINPSNKKRIKGYLPRDEEWNKDFDKAKLMGKQTIKIDSSSVRMLDAFISECSSNKIKFAMVYSPEYIEGQALISNRDSIINIYKELSIDHKIPFYDFSNDSISFSKDFFYNSQHLNKKGSILFSDRLVEMLVQDKFFEE